MQSENANKISWKRLAALDDLEENQPIEGSIGRKTFLVVRSGDTVHACGNKCTHYGGPLSDGLLKGGEIICPWHAARFHVADGRATAAPALDDISSFRTKVENGEVLIGPIMERKPIVASIRKGETFVIAGAGGAGNAAAETLRREGFAGRIVLVSEEHPQPYDRPNLSKGFLSGEDPAEWLPLRSGEFYDDWNIELISDTRVVEVRPNDNRLYLSNSEFIQYDSLLLATGGRAKKLSIPGFELNRSFTLRNLSDGEKIVRAVEGAKNAVVIGASFIGLEVAASLKARGLEVAVVAPEAVPLEAIFGGRIGKHIIALHESQGVRFHLSKTPKEFLGRDLVEGVILSDGTRLPADFIVTGIGIEPAVSFLEGSGLAVDGEVPVNSHLKTEFDNIFAAGDIAGVRNRRSGKTSRVEHWVVAERQGQHAARGMLGQLQPYREIPFFWSKQFGSSLKFLGHSGRYDSVVYRGDVEGGAFLAGYFIDGMLRAVATIGMGKDALDLGRIIEESKTVKPEEFEESKSVDDLISKAE